MREVCDALNIQSSNHMAPRKEALTMASSRSGNSVDSS
jgi:hypothetical protein